jgi:hypothetical protein
LVTFFGWSPIVWRAHQHVHIMPLYLVHTCHGPPYQMTFWLNCPRNILHPNLHHILHYELAHQICFRPQSCLVLFGHLLKVIWIFDIVVKKKSYGATQQHIFFTLMRSCSLANAYKNGITSCMCSTLPQSHMPMYITFYLFIAKCNMTLSFNKSSCQILKRHITFIMFMNAHASFTWFCLKVASCVHPSIFSPFYCKKWANIPCSNSTFLETCPHSITMCKPPCYLNGWLWIWWHLNVCMGIITWQLNIAYTLLIYHSFWVSSPPTHWYFKCNWTFQFAPHHKHHNYPHLITKVTQLLC